jgi:hypothetical protein
VENQQLEEFANQLEQQEVQAMAGQVVLLDYIHRQGYGFWNWKNF